MKLDNIISLFVPKDKIFFTLFEKLAENLEEISAAMTSMVNATTKEKRKEWATTITRLENVGDTYTHDVFIQLSVNFITPFDREDIHYLVSSIDDVADHICGAAKRIDMYNIDTIDSPMIRLAELVEKGSNELGIALRGLRNMKNIGRIKESCIRINSIENNADDVFEMAIANLFEDEKDAIKLIKIKEIYASLEEATDKCEDAAHVIEPILVKHA